MAGQIEKDGAEVSVVVPAYNSSKTIIDAIRSLINQDHSGGLEILIIDDGSTDETVRTISEFTKTLENCKGRHRKPTIKLLTEPHRGPASARNRGIRESNGELVLFTDADCIPNPSWISAIVKEMADKQIAGVGGTYRTRNPESWVARYVGYDIEYRHAQMGKLIDFVGTYSCGLRKSVLETVGGFDEDFESANAEDNDLSYKIKDRGYLLAFARDAWVYHTHPSTLAAFLRQQFWRARWRVVLYYKRPRWIKGDSYAGLETFLQPILWAATLLVTSALFGLSRLMEAAIVLLGVLLVLLIMNSKFLQFVWRQEDSLFRTFRCFVGSILRSLAWMMGGILGVAILVLQGWKSFSHGR